MKIDAKTRQLEAIILERRKKDVSKENITTPDLQTIQQDIQPIQPAIQPEVQPIQHIQPEAQPIQPIQPEAQPIQPIQPEAQPIQHIQPEAQPIQHIQPEAQPIQHIQPEAQPIQHIQPEVQQPPHLQVPPAQDTSSLSYITERQNSPYWPRNHYDSSPYSAFHRYSYVGDMMATQHPHTSAMPTHDFHVLGSQRDTQEQCARLELENVKLYNENKDLRKEIDDLRMQLQETQHGQPDDIVTPKKVEFLKQLVSSFEKKAKAQQSTKRKLLQQTTLRLTYSNPSTPNRLDEEEAEAEVVVLPIPSGVLEEPSRNQEDVSYGQRTCHWEECVTSSGVRKVRLVPDLEVYVSHAQLSQVQHLGGSNPRKMTIALMDILFTREQLAKSSARGSKKAHNAKIDTVQLPPTATLAIIIKQFVLIHFKRSDGTACLEDSLFNGVMNSKCATARRAFNRDK